MRIVSHLGPMSSKVHHPNGKVLPVKASGGLGLFETLTCWMVSDTMYISLYIIIYQYIYTHKSSKYVYVILHYWTYSILFVSLMCHMLDDRQGPSLDISGVTVVR